MFKNIDLSLLHCQRIQTTTIQGQEVRGYVLTQGPRPFITPTPTPIPCPTCGTSGHDRENLTNNLFVFGTRGMTLDANPQAASASDLALNGRVTQHLRTGTWPRIWTQILFRIISTGISTLIRQTMAQHSYLSFSPAVMNDMLFLSVRRRYLPPNWYQRHDIISQILDNQCLIHNRPECMRCQWSESEPEPGDWLPINWHSIRGQRFNCVSSEDAHVP